jgi:hypothetical protein
VLTLVTCLFITESASLIILCFVAKEEAFEVAGIKASGACNKFELVIGLFCCPGVCSLTSLSPAREHYWSTMH